MKTPNPFYYGNEVYDDDFCNRVQELQELAQDVSSGQNLLLYAPRRFGKTSLLKKLKHKLDKQKDYKVIFIDLFSVSSIDEFIQKYFNLIINSFENNTQKALRNIKEVLNIRPNVTMSINETGNISYSLSISKKEQNQTLEDVLNLPSIYAKKFNKKVVVIFDEFQEIEQLKFEKKLRTILQSHSREVSYIFSGSKKSILNQMFSDNSRAFYKSVKHFHIEQIKLDEWIVFIENKFKQTNKEIEKRYIKQVFDITDGFPYYMQQIMSMIWEKTSQNVDDDILKQSLELIIQREYDLYSFIWSSLTPNQKNTLKYIVHVDGLNLYSNDHLQEFNFSATTLKSTLEALLKKDICDKKDDRYYLVDPFMKYWLETIG
ncbi:ATP-binding protein [Sulfurimonas sp. NWX367]|uniref:AAA family ATPase n=1 Tax=Sulfurimonas sp. NWX367 TaxID=2925413 RepID=UPI003204B891